MKTYLSPLFSGLMAAEHTLFVCLQGRLAKLIDSRIRIALLMSSKNMPKLTRNLPVLFRFRIHNRAPFFLYDTHKRYHFFKWSLGVTRKFIMVRVLLWRSYGAYTMHWRFGFKRLICGHCCTVFESDWTDIVEISRLVLA